MSRSLSRPRALASGALAAMILATPGLALAQDFDRVVPRLPAQPPVPQVQLPPSAEPTPSDGAVLVPRLNALVFVDGLAALQPEGVDPAAVEGGVWTAGVPLLNTEAFAARVRPYLGRPLTRADLDAISQMVRDAYNAAERPFMEVSIPPQNIQSGAVQIVVTEYRVGEVRVSGQEHFSEEVIQRMGDLQRGELLTLPRLRRALDDTNQNPFLTVDAVVEPGAETGYTDVVLHAEDRLPLRAYVGYDNQGVRTLGRDEWYAGFNWGNLFGSGSIFSYQYTESFTARYTSHSASTVIPLRGGDRVLMFGAYSIQRPDIGFLFTSKGESGQGSIRYVHELESPSDLEQNLQLGMDYKQANSNLEFLGFRVLDHTVEVVQFPFIYSATSRDANGQTDIENILVFSPGGLTTRNSDEDIGLLVPGARATYVYDRLSLTRTTFLPGDNSWIFRILGQISTSNLPYSEQIGAGGIGSVRGYDTNIALGSEGVLMTNEFRTQPFRLPPMVRDGSGDSDWVQFGLFWDYAHLTQDRIVTDLPRSATLSSVGFNVHYNVGRYFNLQFEVGRQLRRAPFFPDKDTQIVVVLTASF